MNFSWQTELVFIFRLLLAGICGFIIGFERKNRAKEAGIRTHFVLACGSALMMIISKYGFGDIVINSAGARGADSARIAAQVVSGVGFLGAGMIFVQKQTITGLTTAAGIWTTAGIGMAIGAGMYIIGISATIIILLAQVLLHKNIKALHVPKNKIIFISGVGAPEFQKFAADSLKSKGINIYDTYVSKYKKSNTSDYKFIVEIPSGVMEDDILSMFDYDCSIRDAIE